MNFFKKIFKRSLGKSLSAFLGGEETTYAGKNVTEENALSSTAVYAAGRAISETVASLPLHLFRRLKNGGKERATDQKLYNIMHLQPNPEMSSMVYRQICASHFLFYGNSYSEIERDLNDNVIGLWPLMPNKMRITRVDGILYYDYSLPSGKTKIFNTSQIMHIRGFSLNGIMGMSPIDKGKQAIGLGMGLEEFGARFFGNGARPGTVLEHPGELSENAIKRLRKAWDDIHGGLSKSNRMAILEEGMKLHEFGVSPQDAQALESRKFQVIEVARLFNVPPHILKDLERSTFNNIEQMGLEYIIYTIRPILVLFEQQYSISLLPENKKSEYFIEHIVDGLLRGDTESRYKAYLIGRQNGWLSANDIRGLENMNPIEGGNIYIVPLNMQPISWMMPESKPDERNIKIEHRSNPTIRLRLQQNYRPLITDAAQRIINKETIAINRAIKTHLGDRNIKSFNDWIDDFYKSMPDYINKNIMPVLLSYGEATALAAAEEIGIEKYSIRSLQEQEELKRFVNKYVNNYSVQHINSSIGQLRGLMKEPGEMEEALIKRADEWHKKRAIKIAGNETIRFSSAISSSVFFENGYSIVWRANTTACPYCLELDGRKVGKGESFIEANTVLQIEDREPMKINRPCMHPQLHQGCDCWIEAG